MPDLRTYRREVFWSADHDAYIATCASFPNLEAAGTTEQEALDNLAGEIKATVAEYADAGWTVPDPGKEDDDFWPLLVIILMTIIFAIVVAWWLL